MLDKLKLHFGLRAWWGAFVMWSEMKHLGGIVDETYLPILRLMYDDPDVVEREWENVKAQRNEIRPWDTPHIRWKKTYGNFVRELDWAYSELRPRMAHADFEDLVVFTMCSRMDSWVGWMKPLLRRSDQPGSASTGSARSDEISAKISAWSLASMSPIVGEMELTGFDDGVAVFHIPDCAMHTVVSETEPQTDACLYGCKAACEAFMGPEVPVSIHFEPNLPAFDCEMRFAMGNKSAVPGVVESTEPELVSA